MIAAEEAAGHWGGRLVRPLSQRENAVFEMATPQGRAALRLHRPGYHGAAAVAAELAWTAALAGAGLPVPRPLSAKAGAPLVTLSDGHRASAVAWLEGEPLGEAGVPLPGPLPQILARHRALGALLARLHAASDAMALPPGWTRPAWDRDGLTGEAPVWGRFWEHPAAGPDDRATLRRARDALRERLADPALGPPGPIHADVLRENVLVAGEALSLIDFDDCGTGFRLYDLGTVLSQNLAEQHYPAIRDAVAEGYGAGDTALLEWMTLARCCASVGWTMPRLAPGHPIHRSHIARATRLAARLVA